MRADIIALLALCLPACISYKDDQVAFDTNYYETEEAGYGSSDPFEALVGQLYWAEQPQLMDKAEKLMLLGNKLIAMVETGKVDEFKTICHPKVVWHGDGMFNPLGFGSTCDDVTKSLKTLLSSYKTQKVETLAVVPNPRNSDVFVLGRWHSAKDKVLGVVRAVVDDDDKVTHVYSMSQTTDAQARLLLKAPEKTIKARAQLPALSIHKYAGVEEERHMITMWAAVNQLWMGLTQDSSSAAEFISLVPDKFRFVAAEQVFEGFTFTSRDDFLNALERAYAAREMQVVQTSAAYSPTHHVVIQHVHYMTMEKETSQVMLAPAIEVHVFDTEDILQEVWTFRQPFSVEERMTYFKQ